MVNFNRVQKEMINRFWLKKKNRIRDTWKILHTLVLVTSVDNKFYQKVHRIKESIS